MLSNGSVILASDLNSAHSAALTSLATSNLYKPTQVPLYFQFSYVVSYELPENNTIKTILTDDFIISEIAVDFNGGNTKIATVTIDNGALIKPIILSETANSNNYKFARYYGTGAATTNNPIQVLLKGSELIVSVTSNITGFITTRPVVNVTILLESRLRRG